MKKAFETSQGEKQNCRDLLCLRSDEYIGYENVKKIFTLPSREALCYKTFKSHYKRPKIVCVERDEEICSYLWDEKNIDCINSSIQEYANEKVSPEQHHDVVFLDYYSFLSENIKRDIRAFIANRNILHKEKKMILGLTLQKGMRKGKEATLESMRDYLYKGHRREMLNTLELTEEFLHNYLACDFDLEEVATLESREYQAAEGSTPMYFFVFGIKL